MEHSCGIYINKIKQVNSRLLNKVLLNKGITEFNGEQSRILHELWKNDNISSKELSKATGLSLNTLTVMLDRMAKINLIVKAQDLEDKRRTLVKLTDFSKNLHSKYKEVVDELVSYAFKGFSKEEIVQFEEYLEKVLMNVEEAEVSLKNK